MRDANKDLWVFGLILLAMLCSGCFGRSGAVGIARADGIEGDPCIQDAHCEAGLMCIGEVCAVASGSARRPTQRDVGAEVGVTPAECDGLVGTVELGDTVHGITDDDHQHVGSCGGNFGPDEVWQLDLSYTAFVIITTEGSPDTDTVLYLRTECADPVTELICNDDDYTTGGVHSRLELELGAGKFFIVVDSFNIGGEYTLRVEELSR